MARAIGSLLVMGLLGMFVLSLLFSVLMPLMLLAVKVAIVLVIGFLILRVQNPIASGPSQTTVHRADAAGRLGPPIAYDVPPGTLRLTADGSRMVYEQVRTRKRRAGPSVFESTIAVRRRSSPMPSTCKSWRSTNCWR